VIIPLHIRDVFESFQGDIASITGRQTQTTAKAATTVVAASFGFKQGLNCHSRKLAGDYLFLRSSTAGTDPKPIFRAFAYLILVALDTLPAENIARLVTDSIFRGKGYEMPENIQEFLLMPIVDQLLSEMQDVCSSDCRRISSSRRTKFTNDKDEIDEYWLRFEREGVEEEAPKESFLLIECYNEPCVVGFSVDKDNGCPLFRLEPSVKNIDEVLAVIKRTACFRKS
jgi:hypothetical protein